MMIIKYYTQNNMFTVFMRNKLVHLIIDHELKESKNETLSTIQLDTLATEIVECFSTESKCVYYSPFSKIGKSVKRTRGKLWDRYNNVRKDIRKLSNSNVVTNKIVLEAEVSSEGISNSVYFLLIKICFIYLNVYISIQNKIKYTLKISILVPNIFFFISFGYDTMAKKQQRTNECSVR